MWRCSTFALLGAALRRLFPSFQLLGGHLNSLGFSYEFIATFPFEEKCLVLLEEQMRALINEKPEVTCREMVSSNAAAYFRHQKEFLKAELLMEIAAEGNPLVHLLQIGDFLEVTPLPGTTDLAEVRAFSLLEKTHERRWIDGQEREVTLIKGTVQRDAKALKQFVKQFRRYQTVNHQTLGQTQELFSFFPPLTCFWKPNGERLRTLILDWWREEMRTLGYAFVSTTGPLSSARFSNHLRFLSEEWKSKLSPVGCAEVALLCGEESQEACGLYTQQTQVVPEATLLCSEDQVKGQLALHIQAILKALALFGFEFSASVSGEAKKLKAALTEAGVSYESTKASSFSLDPRIDFHLFDALGRKWVGPSLAMPKREGGCVITCQLIGSLDRWIGLLLEQAEGELPFWLAPEQIRVLPLGKKYEEQAESVRVTLEEAGYRAQVDSGEEKLATKIYQCESACIPYALILGAEELAQQKVTVRRAKEKDAGKALTLKEFLASLQREAQSTKSNIKEQEKRIES